MVLPFPFFVSMTHMLLACIPSLLPQFQLYKMFTNRHYLGTGRGINYCYSSLLVRLTCCLPKLQPISLLLSLRSLAHPSQTSTKQASQPASQPARKQANSPSSVRVCVSLCPPSDCHHYYCYHHQHRDILPQNLSFLLSGSNVCRCFKF